jgi:hypothetical protein
MNRQQAAEAARAELARWRELEAAEAQRTAGRDAGAAAPSAAAPAPAAAQPAAATASPAATGAVRPPARIRQL